MNLYPGRFVISRSNEEGDVWAETGHGGIAIMRGRATRPDDGEIILSLRPDEIERLDAWAHQEGLTVLFSGVLAKQIKDLSRDVGLSPQNFVLEALNAFIQAGEMASGHGHAHTPPPAQNIELEGP